MSVLAKHIFKLQGKRSRAWWLQAIKWFGRDGLSGIMRGGNVASIYVSNAVELLVNEGYVVRDGKRGSGVKQLLTLSSLGHRYLNEHQEELEEPEPEKTDRGGVSTKWPIPQSARRYTRPGNLAGGCAHA